jgi:hypothetical protein
MTSVAPHAPLLALSQSAAGQSPLLRDEGCAATPSFELLLSDASRARTPSPNASFAETGTLGFEDGKMLTAHLEPTPAGHAPLALQPPVDITVQAAGLVSEAMTALDRILPPGKDIAPQASSEQARLSSDTRIQQSLLRTQPVIAPALRATLSTIAPAKNESSDTQLAAANTRKLLEGDLAASGAAVSVTVEQMDSGLRIHLHLPACARDT